MASAGPAVVRAERFRLAPWHVCDWKRVQLFPLFHIKIQGCGWVTRNCFFFLFASAGSEDGHAAARSLPSLAWVTPGPFSRILKCYAFVFVMLPFVVVNVQ